MRTAKQAPIRVPTETVPAHDSVGHGAACCGATGGVKKARMMVIVASADVGIPAAILDSVSWRLLLTLCLVVADWFHICIMIRKKIETH